MKVLAIDDSSAVTNLIKTTLDSEVAKTIECNDPTEAVNLFVKHKPDLVIVDNNMTGIKGLDLLKRIQKIDKNVPVIVSVSSLDWEVIIRYIHAGAVGYLLKPFSRLDLINTVHDPWGKYDVKPVMIFSISLNRMQDLMQKIFQTEVSITIKKINILKAKGKEAEIISGDKRLADVNLTKKLEEIIMARPLGYACNSLKFTDHLNGYVTLSANKAHCNSLISDVKGYFGMQNGSTLKQFYYVLISRLLSTITDLTGLNIQEESISELDPSTILAGIRKKGVLSALCEIKMSGFEMPIGFEIWTDIENLLKKIGK